MATLCRTRLILLLVCVSGISACNWVDSVGIQGAGGDVDSGMNVSGVDFESALVPLQEGVPAALSENTASTTQLLNDNSRNGIWSWELSAEGENARCDGINGFNSTFAGNTLLSSCTDPTECEIHIEPVSITEPSTYIIELPSLVAPVALNYRLTSDLADGTRIQREQIVCALSINEAPTAVDDSYRAFAGATLHVAGTDANSLLANDKDDIDVRNQSLRVDTRVASAPQYASAFTLLDDGGFSYQPPDQLPFDSNGILIDSFDYRIGDGLHEATATAAIRITATDEVPIAITTNQPPVVTDIANRTVQDDFEYDISGFFTDPDGDVLTFSTPRLPPGVSLSADGILTGRSNRP